MRSQIEAVTQRFVAMSDSDPQQPPSAFGVACDEQRC